MGLGCGYKAGEMTQPHTEKRVVDAQTAGGSEQSRFVHMARDKCTKFASIILMGFNIKFFIRPTKKKLIEINNFRNRSKNNRSDKTSKIV
jgi:hypothetical protein